MAVAGDRESLRVDGADHIEIDEAVIDRRDQRIGHRMRKPHQVIIVSGRIHHDKAAALRQFINAAGKRSLQRRLIFVGDGLVERKVVRDSEGRG